MARTERPDDFDDSDIYIVSDAGRAGNKSLVLNSFTNLAGQARATNNASVVAVNFCLASHYTLRFGGRDSGNPQEGDPPRHRAHQRGQPHREA